MSAPSITAAGWSATAGTYSSMAAIPDAISAAAAAALFPPGETGAGAVFVDVAAGPGVLSLQVLRRWAEQRAAASGRAGGTDTQPPPTLIVTDFAPGMVDAARARLGGEEAARLLPPGAQLQFAVADAADLTGVVPTGTATHAGCTLSLNLIPRRAQALAELRRVLAPGGRAVVATFRRTATAELAADYAAALGALPLDAATGAPVLPPAVAAAVTALADPGALAAELAAAGFGDVAVTAAPFTFKTADTAAVLAMFRGNPAMRAVFEGAPPGADFDGVWATFLAPGGGGGHAKYVVMERQAGAPADAPPVPHLVLPMVANIAVATAV